MTRGTRVKWTSRRFDQSDYIVNEWVGYVIGDTKSLFGDTYLLVACDDGAVREVHISKVKVIPNN